MKKNIYYIINKLIYLMKGTYPYEQYFETGEKNKQIMKNANICNYSFFSHKINNPLKIIHISDLHNYPYEIHSSRIISQCQQINPDFFILSGDMIDLNWYSEMGVDINENLLQLNALKIIKDLRLIAPVFYTYGNNEKFSTPQKNVIERFLIENGITLLNNAISTFTIKNNNITISGLRDPILIPKEEHSLKCIKKEMHKEIQILSEQVKENNNLNILISHRPEYLESYWKSNFDITFTGHSHGGQICISPTNKKNPLLPFKKIYYGAYEKDNKVMIVNGGLGVSDLALRIHSDPEIGVINIVKK